MKKHFLATLVAVMLCCLVALSGCAVSVFEKDVNVVFENNGKYVGGVTVNAFNNAIAPVFDEEAEGAVSEGYKFMGWSVKADWKYGDSRDLLISSGGIVRYEFVKDYANEGGTVVARPVIIAKDTIPKADLVIAWYGKTSTSGIAQENMDAFEKDLRAYLTAEGLNLSDTEIVIRSYEGNVGPSCENIRKDDDVDIMIGWSNTDNLIGTGGMVAGKHVLENVGGITIGSKERYSARLTDRELCVKVYGWIQEKYGNGATPEILQPAPDTPDTPDTPDVPDTPDTPDTQSGIRYTVGAEDVLTLRIGCYGLLVTSGFTDAIKAQFEEGLKVALKECGATDEQLAGVEVKFYCYSTAEKSDSTTNVAALDAAIQADGGVDILLGGRALSEKNAPYLNPLIKESSSDMTIGSVTNRKVIRFNNKGLTLAIYNWLATPEGLALLATPAAA